MVLDGQRYARQSASDSSTSQSPDLWSFRNIRQQTAAQVHIAPAVPSVASSVEPMEVDTTAQSIRGAGNPEVGGKKTSHFDSARVSKPGKNRGLNTLFKSQNFAIPIFKFEQPRGYKVINSPPKWGALFFFFNLKGPVGLCFLNPLLGFVPNLFKVLRSPL